MAIAEAVAPATTEYDVLATDIDRRLVVPVSPESADAAPTGWRSPGWQVGIFVAGWPVWWAIGITQFVAPVLAFGLARELRRRGPVRLPPGFWLWALFLLWVIASGLALNVTASGTLPTSGLGRYIAYTVRTLNYLSVTVMAIYVGNLTERELPRRRVIAWMASLAVTTICLGTLAVGFPHFAFDTLISHVVPSKFLGLDGGQAALAQLQPVLGDPSPRPSAPFAFANAWGNSLSLLMVWLVVAGSVHSSRRKIVAGCLLAVALVPIVYSLDRGMWIGIGLSAGIVAVRLALRGRLAAIGVLATVVTFGALIVVASPLSTLIQERLNAGHSNEVRRSLASDSVKGAFESPILGFGSTRATLGSDASITIGQTADCPRCGNRDIGSTGQLWLVMFAQGIIGALFYVGFLLRSMWAYRGDHSILGIAGWLVIFLQLFYGAFYSALIIPLMVTLLAVALLWRNEQLRDEYGEFGGTDVALVTTRPFEVRVRRP